MVKHADHCLDVFVHDLPRDYRKRTLPYQPDIVWGERVLVNFRDTLDVLNNAFVRLTPGDMAALQAANGVSNDAIALSRDCSPDWMDEPNVAKVVPKRADEFSRLLAQARRRASNINPTWGGYWVTGSLTTRFNPGSRGELRPPSQWPTYRLQPRVRCISGQPVPRSGIYLPDADNSIAAFMIEGKPAFKASVGFDPKTTQRMTQAETAWTLVERIADSGGGTPGAADPLVAGVRLRCEAKQPCPREGYWFTPARAHSRRRFKSDETMPEVGGSYGVTVWQRDEQQ